mmetsp:Transcript_59285/g.141314  ORF Transcript_59285/g.141314 Transcript_59285/m.141314 type:complete len:516 (-) Transcript_59285:42-1589(-)
MRLRPVATTHALPDRRSGRPRLVTQLDRLARVASCGAGLRRALLDDLSSSDLQLNRLLLLQLPFHLHHDLPLGLILLLLQAVLLRLLPHLLLHQPQLLLQFLDPLRCRVRQWLRALRLPLLLQLLLKLLELLRRRRSRRWRRCRWRRGGRRGGHHGGQLSHVFKRPPTPCLLGLMSLDREVGVLPGNGCRRGLARQSGAAFRRHNGISFRALANTMLLEPNTLTCLCRSYPARHVRGHHLFAEDPGGLRVSVLRHGKAEETTTHAEVQMPREQRPLIQLLTVDQEGVLACKHQHIHGDASSPHVTRVIVTLAASRQLVLLRRHEGRGAALVGEQSIGRQLHCQPKVRELQHLVVHHEVVGLDVPVANVLAVQDPNGRDDLVHPVCSHGLLQLHALLPHLVPEVAAVAVFQRQEDTLRILPGAEELRHIRVTHSLHHRHFSLDVGSPHPALGQHRLVQLLHGHYRLGLPVHCTPHCAERALSELDLLQEVALGRRLLQRDSLPHGLRSSSSNMPHG